MSQPLVSFLIAAFNEEKFIEACIASCLEQTYPNIEVCITDDGSTDKTREKILHKFSDDSRVKFNSFTHNRGKVAAFNSSCEMASGEYLALQGADDIAIKNRIENSLSFLLAGNYDLVWGNSIVCDEKLENQRHFSCRLSPEETTVEKLLEGNFISGNTIFFNRKIAEKAFPIPETLLFEDWWININALLHGKAGYLDAEMVYYRQHNNNDCGTDLSASPEKSIKNILRHEAYFKEFFRLFQDSKSPESSFYLQVARLSWAFRRFILTPNFLERLKILKKERPTFFLNSLGIKTLLALFLGKKIYSLKGLLQKN